jgi:hypothetical protein
MPCRASSTHKVRQSARVSADRSTRRAVRRRLGQAWYAPGCPRGHPGCIRRVRERPHLPRGEALRERKVTVLTASAVCLGVRCGRRQRAHGVHPRVGTRVPSASRRLLTPDGRARRHGRGRTRHRPHGVAHSGGKPRSAHRRDSPRSASAFTLTPSARARSCRRSPCARASHSVMPPQAPVPRGRAPCGLSASGTAAAGGDPPPCVAMACTTKG